MKEQTTAKTATYTYTLTSGAECELRATYTTIIRTKTAWVDETVELAGTETIHGGTLEVWVDGKKLDSCNSPSFWAYVDKAKVNGRTVWIVRGTKAAMVNEADVERYKAFIAELTAATQQGDENSADKAEAQSIVAAYERGFAARDAQDAANKASDYRRNMLEGGEGYCPVWYTRAQYEAASAVLAKI